MVLYRSTKMQRGTSRFETEFEIIVKDDSKQPDKPKESTNGEG